MIGFGIRQRARKAPQALVDLARGLPVANISDCASRLYAAGAALRPLHAGGYLAGPAFTVVVRPGDNLMIHKALDLAEPGDVLVVDGGGDLTNALMGELMISHARQRGLAGVVVNGAVRDSAWIAQTEFPVYALGITHRGPYKDGPGVINAPVAIGGMVIEPGALVLGDRDGVIALDLDEAEAVLAAAHALWRDEEAKMQNILAGRNDRSWVDPLLRAKGLDV